MASEIRYVRVFTALLRAAFLLVLTATAFAQSAAQAPQPVSADYVVGPQDVLTITSYDQADLSGKFAVEADGTFTYPMIGRVKAGGLTLRAGRGAAEEAAERRRLLQEPADHRRRSIPYKSQKVFIVGEVRTPGTYPLSGDMNLVEALARAGSTLPTASGEAIIVHRRRADRRPGRRCRPRQTPTNIVRVDLRELQNGAFSQNAAAPRRRHHLRAAGRERLCVRPGQESRRLRAAAAEHHRAAGAVAGRRRHRPRLDRRGSRSSASSTARRRN